MSNHKTGLLYLGNRTIFAYKRSLSRGHFIPIEKLYDLFGVKNGFHALDMEFLKWFYNNKVKNSVNYKLVVEKEEFDENGIFLGVSGKKNLNRKETEQRELKSSQRLIKEAAEYREESVEVISSPLMVTDSPEKASKNLQQQSKQAHDHGGKVRQNSASSPIKEKPKKVEPEEVVVSGNSSPQRDKEKKAIAKALIMQSAEDPLGVEASKEGQVFNPTEGPGSRVFIAEPPLSNKNVGSGNELVNYGGKSYKPPVEVATSSSEKIKGEKIRGGNIMTQPAQGSIETTNKVTVDSIVRSATDEEGRLLIEKCKNPQILKAAAKKLRSMGTRYKLEEAISIRLNYLPPM